jgi:hypothetical protein
MMLWAERFGLSLRDYVRNKRIAYRKRKVAEWRTRTTRPASRVARTNLAYPEDWQVERLLFGDVIAFRKEPR